MVVKNGKTPVRRKSASSSAKSSRSNLLSKSSTNSCRVREADELDGVVDRAQTAALESEAGNSVLEETGADGRTPRNDLPAESVELTAITLHQPWASLIAAGKKQYETRSWSTNYRGPIAIHAGKKLHKDKSLISLLEVEFSNIPLGAIIATADLTDCILIDQEFILKQSSFEQYLGLWEVGRYAWKLENVRAIEPIQATGKQGLWKWAFGELEKEEGRRKKEEGAWNPADFGEAEYKSEANGQLNFLEVSEPPEPDDYDSIEQFDAAYKNWCVAQTDEAEEELANYGLDELWNQLMDGSICAAELVSASPLPESNCGDDRPITLSNGIAIVNQSSQKGIQKPEDLATSKPLSGTEILKVKHLTSSLLPLPANPLAKTADNSGQPTIEIVSPTCSKRSTSSDLDSQSSKASLDSLTVQSNQEEAIDFISPESLSIFPRAGTTRNGNVSEARIFPALGCDQESLLLRSPGALSTTIGRPPGKSRLESQLHQLGLIQDGEVVNPEFLEVGYNLPTGFSNPNEERTALELAQVQAQQQQQSIAPSSELLQETETTAIAVQPSETLLTGELQPLDSSELIISLDLPSNIGALTKAELISMAQEQHELICVIERKEFELALEKLHRVRLTGVYLQEFKKKCQHGEFENQLEQAGIGVRSAQNYMTIAKNWEIVEAKTQLVALLTEESQPAIGLKWALEAVRDEKKQLKSAAPPKDPDEWRTPNTKEQPIVNLVKQALGGNIWLDPCSDSSAKVPASVRYFKSDDGLAESNAWTRTVFVNPPFSDPSPWVEKCCLSIARGNVSAAIMLLKAGTVSNVGTGELISQYASAVCHWRGRINFLNDEGNAVKGSDFDCVLIYFGDRLDLFRQAFSQRGTISTIDNHFSSVNKKFTSNGDSVNQEHKQLAAAVGLSNGKSLLPDRRDADRNLLEQYDPHTVIEVPQVSESLFSIEQSKVFDKTDSIVAEFQQAKSDCLNDYVTAISGNISAFSDEQIAFLAKIIVEERAKRIGF